MIVTYSVIDRLNMLNAQQIRPKSVELDEEECKMLAEELENDTRGLGQWPFKVIGVINATEARKEKHTEEHKNTNERGKAAKTSGSNRS